MKSNLKKLSISLALALSILTGTLVMTGCDKSILDASHEVVSGAIDATSAAEVLLPPGDERLPKIREWKARCIELDARLATWDGVETREIILGLAVASEGFQTLILPLLGNNLNLRIAAAVFDGGLRYLARKFQKLAEKNGAQMAAMMADDDVRRSVAQIEAYLKTPPVKK